MIGRLTPGRVEAALWMVLCGGLAIGIGQQTDWGRRPDWPAPELGPVSGDFAKPSLAEPFRLPPPDTYLETTLRPLFLVTRRPAPLPPPPEPPKPSMRKDQFVLTGTTIVPEGKYAFLLEKAGNKVRVVAEGKEINGIRVKEVGATRVILTQHDDEEVLVLKPAKPPGQPAIPPTVAAGARRLPGPNGQAGALPPPAGIGRTQLTRKLI